MKDILDLTFRYIFHVLKTGAEEPQLSMREQMRKLRPLENRPGKDRILLSRPASK